MYSTRIALYESNLLKWNECERHSIKKADQWETERNVVVSSEQMEILLPLSNIVCDLPCEYSGQVE